MKGYVALRCILGRCPGSCTVRPPSDTDLGHLGAGPSSASDVLVLVLQVRAVAGALGRTGAPRGRPAPPGAPRCVPRRASGFGCQYTIFLHAQPWPGTRLSLRVVYVLSPEPRVAAGCRHEISMCHTGMQSPQLCYQREWQSHGPTALACTCDASPRCPQRDGRSSSLPAKVSTRRQHTSRDEASCVESEGSNICAAEVQSGDGGQSYLLESHRTLNVMRRRLMLMPEAISGGCCQLLPWLQAVQRPHVRAGHPGITTQAQRSRQPS